MIAHSLFALLRAKSFFVPCPVKWLTGLDCPGCGFQRSFWALIQGDFQESFTLYPPLSAFLISFSAAIFVYATKGNRNALGLKLLYVATGLIVLINYGYKIAMGQL